MRKGKIKEYNYLLFDYIKLIDLCKTKKELIKSFENSIRILRNYRESIKFTILDLIQEEINFNPYLCLYFIIYKDDEIIACSRIIQFKKNQNIGYINMVYTNINYRNKKICQINLKKLIKLTNFDKYELDVNTTNNPAIKCYENIGFQFIKEYERNNEKYNLMEYNNL